MVLFLKQKGLIWDMVFIIMNNKHNNNEQLEAFRYTWWYKIWKPLSCPHHDHMQNISLFSVSKYTEHHR